MVYRDDESIGGRYTGMHYKVAIIVSYFGRLNNYFGLWLHSAGYNKEFNFWLFTDDESVEQYDCPENVNIVFMKFDDIRDKVSTILNYKFVLHNPYKLCDYKPLYGQIFKQYIESYDFWGHCDLDIIWGNLGKYITDDILEKYDRIYRSGHLCFYRNCEHMNNIVIDMQNATRGGGMP